MFVPLVIVKLSADAVSLVVDGTSVVFTVSVPGAGCAEDEDDETGAVEADEEDDELELLDEEDGGGGGGGGGGAVRNPDKQQFLSRQTSRRTDVSLNNS